MLHFIFPRVELPDILASSILSLQIDTLSNSLTADSLKMYPIMMMFDVVSHCIVAFMHLIQI